MTPERLEELRGTYDRHWDGDMAHPSDDVQELIAEIDRLKAERAKTHLETANIFNRLEKSYSFFLDDTLGEQQRIDGLGKGVEQAGLAFRELLGFVPFDPPICSSEFHGRGLRNYENMPPDTYYLWGGLDDHRCHMLLGTYPIDPETIRAEERQEAAEAQRKEDEKRIQILGWGARPKVVILGVEKFSDLVMEDVLCEYHPGEKLVFTLKGPTEKKFLLHMHRPKFTEHEIDDLWPLYKPDPVQA